MKGLFLFATSFPYGTKEAYLETESKFYGVFDKVTIFSLNVKKADVGKKRDVGNNVTVIPILYAPIAYIFNVFTVFTDPNFYQELKEMIRAKRFTVGRLIYLLKYLSRAHYECRQILKKVGKKDLRDAVLFSCRFEYQPYVALLLKKRLSLKADVVARAHRYDLYEDQNKYHYIPMRRILLNELKYVFPCSEDGKDDLIEKYPEFEKKIKAKFVGTLDHGIKNFQPERTIHIVSCSTLTPVKRVDQIVRALSAIDDLEIEWDHYGAGALMEQVASLADTILPPNVKAQFHGNVDNIRLLEEYSNRNYFLFLNVSESEGIPAAIMEAMSFGIPCIATDVGGTREIVEKDSGGTLLSKDFTPEQLTSEIRRYCTMPEAEYLACRRAARAAWDRKFNASKNYTQFFQEMVNGY